MANWTKAVSCVILPLLLTGCSDDLFGGDSQRFHEDFQYSYELTPGGRVSVDNLNGSVEISGWDRNTVEIVGTKYAADESLMRSIRIDIQHSSGSVRVKTEVPFQLRGNYGVKYVLHVPRRVELDEIKSSNGSIRVEDTQGLARLRTSNGTIRIARLTGNLEAHSSNGSVEVRGLQGPATVTTSNGRIDLDEVKGSLEATTSNGRITAAIADPAPQQPVRLTSSNGQIDLTMRELRDNPLHLSTSNASITVHLPSSANAQVDAHTSNSNVSTDFDVLVRGGEHSKKRLNGSIGRGGPTVSLTTSNGSIKLLKSL